MSELQLGCDILSLSPPAWIFFFFWRGWRQGWGIGVSCQLRNPRARDVQKLLSQHATYESGHTSSWSSLCVTFCGWQILCMSVSRCVCHTPIMKKTTTKKQRHHHLVCDHVRKRDSPLWIWLVISGSTKYLKKLSVCWFQENTFVI